MATYFVTDRDVQEVFNGVDLTFKAAEPREVRPSLHKQAIGLGATKFTAKSVEDKAYQDAVAKAQKAAAELEKALAEAEAEAAQE